LSAIAFFHNLIAYLASHSLHAPTILTGRLSAYAAEKRGQILRMAETRAMGDLVERKRRGRK